ncbi:flagellar M-ring protein FliF [Oscillospiraceae bacterium CM]|nr:flagellar M-ring protein FliF [Oscillospiraceae bacterium CM]
MAAFMKSMLDRTREFFQNIEKKKLIMLISLAVTVVAAGVVGALLLNQVHYTVLYSGLDAGEAGTIKTLLDNKGVKSKVQGTSTILVPDDQADELRIELASEGYPSTGLNYDIFSNSSAIGSTDLERRTYLQYQLQENMRATINKMDKIQDSVVIVNLASDSSFVVTDTTKDASVAVMLKLKDTQTLTSGEAKTIGEFVLKCVPDLKPENVSIVDAKMNSYSINEDDGAGEYSASQQQLTEQMKSILSDQALNILEPVIGTGNVAVSVNLSLDFDKQTVSKVEFAPPIAGETDGLVRSSEEIINASGTGTTGASGSAGTDTNGTGTPAYVADTTGTGSSSTNSSKTYNYELNEIQTQIEKAQGSVQNLSVAVLVNSSAADGIDGYVDKVKNLVAKAIGVKPDYISVELMPFSQSNGIDSAFEQNQDTIKQVTQNSLIKTIVTIAALLAAVIITLRFFGKRTFKHREDEGHGLKPQPVGVTAGDGDVMPELPNFDLADLVLKKSTEAEKIEELMDRYPETVALILRTWLAEDN